MGICCELNGYMVFKINSYKRLSFIDNKYNR